MHAAIATHLHSIRGLCLRFGVRRLEVFGSAARGAGFREDASDADFLVAFGSVDHLRPLDQFVGFAEALRDTLGRPVDLVEAGALSNPFVIAEIEAERELVFG
jgi:predicted nucleotidyltransferase